jgi:LmbE family N-acetylglucosaminyl deacetylase
MKLRSDISRRWAFLTSRLRASQDVAQTPAIVFAPHQDDETLGCGGTILLKRQHGTPVTIVYMTDGASSSGNREITAQKTTRHEEALAACQMLGVDSENVVFLDFPDGDLESHIVPAAEKVQALLENRQGYEIYVPHVQDGHEDHEATRDIVVTVAQSLENPATIFEFPVWLWYGFPVTNAQWSGLGDIKDNARQLLQFIKQFGSGFNRKVKVNAVNDRKRQALEQHVSQMTNKYDPTTEPLSSIGEGEWLNCFFSGYEIFRQYRV